VKCYDKRNQNAPSQRGNSGCVTVTLRQKKEKPILTGRQKHFNATCMATKRLLMICTGITPYLCGEVKQVTALWVESLLNLYSAL